MPTALVTGITGQDGGYLADRLVAEGWQVHGLVHGSDHAVPDLLARVPQVVLHDGDLADTHSVARVVDAVAPEEIYNLGGVSSVGFSWDQPLLTTQVTALGAAAVFEAAWRLQQDRRRPVRVLQASSAEIFGNAPVSPQSESTPIGAQSPYGAAKAFAHLLAGVYRTRGLGVSTCILYNHESPRRPDTFVTRKITKAAVRIARGEQDVLELGNLDARRDWGWAPDYVDAMVRANRFRHADDYVVATGRSHSVADFVAAAFGCVGIAQWRPLVRVDDSLARPADAAEQVGDAGKARDVLGWAPTVDFPDMVARMVDADR